MRDEIDYLIAGFGKRSERRLALSLAPNLGELPGTGWRRAGQRVTRTGTALGRVPKDGGGFATPVAERARRAGGFAVLRVFVQRERKCSLELGVAKYASAADAELVVARSHELILPSSRMETSLVAERVPEDLVVPGVDHFRLSEREWQVFVGERDRVVTRRLRASIAVFTFLARCTSSPEQVCSWAEIVGLAETWAAKVRGLEAALVEPSGT